VLRNDDNLGKKIIFAVYKSLIFYRKSIKAIENFKKVALRNRKIYNMVFKFRFYSTIIGEVLFGWTEFLYTNSVVPAR